MSNKPYYYVAEGGLPQQSARLWQCAIFTTSYAFIPKGVMTDIVTSFLPFWQGARDFGCWPGH